MKIAAFADVHGNIYAFKKVWAALKKEKADRYIFCGDICGYYYDQNEVIDILKGIKGLVAVRGNHDAMFLRSLKSPARAAAYEARYGRANTLLKDTITKENLEFLKRLPAKRILKREGVAVFHGSPWDGDEYVYPTSTIKRFGKLKYRFVFLGHTHHPMDRTAGRVRIINPGSCGQPRDYNAPSYCVLDTDKGDLRFKRVSYDVRKLMKDVAARGEQNEYLINVLKRKKRNG